MKGRKPTARRVAFAEIAKARVEIEFNRKQDQGRDDRAEQNDESQEEA